MTTPVTKSATICPGSKAYAHFSSHDILSSKTAYASLSPALRTFPVEISSPSFIAVVDNAPIPAPINAPAKILPAPSKEP